MRYRILETPGREEVELEELPNGQQEAQIVIARLRGEARKEGRQIDFVAVPSQGSSPNNGNGAAATSVRVTEDIRARLARHCGRIMQETGKMPVKMEDALIQLLDHFDATNDGNGTVESFTLDAFDDDEVIARARQILSDRKAAT